MDKQGALFQWLPFVKVKMFESMYCFINGFVIIFIL